MTDQPVGTEVPEAEKIARAFHDEYEAFAQMYGWETQQATRVSFDELPAENQQTMISTVRALLNRRVITRQRPVYGARRDNAEQRAETLEKSREQWLGEVREALETKAAEFEREAPEAPMTPTVRAIRLTKAQALRDFAATIADQSSTECERCQGTGEMMVDHGRSLASTATTVECLACHGTGRKPPGRVWGEEHGRWESSAD